MSDESATGDVPVTKGAIGADTSGDATNGVSGEEEHNDTTMSSEGQSTDHDSPASPDPMNDTNTSVYSEKHENGQSEEQPLSFEVLDPSQGKEEGHEPADSRVNDEEQRLDSGPPSSFYMVGSDDSLEPKENVEAASPKDAKSDETEKSPEHEEGKESEETEKPPEHEEGKESEETEKSPEHEEGKDGAGAGEADESKTESHTEDDDFKKGDSIEPEGDVKPDSGRESPVLSPATPNTNEGDIMQKSIMDELKDASTEEPSIYKIGEGGEDTPEDEDDDSSPTPEKPATTDTPEAVSSESPAAVPTETPTAAPAVPSETPAAHSPVSTETAEVKNEDAAPSDPLSLASAKPEAVSPEAFSLEPRVPSDSHPEPKDNGAIHENHSEDAIPTEALKEDAQPKSEPAQVYHRQNQDSDSEEESSRPKKSSKNTSKAAGCLCC